MIITLISGNTVDAAKVVFQPNTYHFLVMNEDGSSQDITKDLTIRDKTTIGGDAYDVNYDLRRISAEGGTKHSGNDHPDGQNIGTVPSESDASTLDQFGRNVSNTITSIGESVAGFTKIGLPSLAIIALVIGGVYLFSKK